MARKWLQRRKYPSIEIFDPGKGEDWRFPVGASDEETFSSLDHGCVVISISWAREWSLFFLEGMTVERIPLEQINSYVVRKTLMEVADEGFFCVNPELSVGNLGSSDEFTISRSRDSLFAYFQIDKQAVELFLSEASARGDHETWIIGSVKDTMGTEELIPTVQSPDLFYFLQHFASLECVWSFDFDIGELVAVFRTFDGYQELVQSMIKPFLPVVVQNKK